MTAKRPNHVWHVDLSAVPTSLGFWIPWLPFALTQRWPFCWWVAVAVDHYSRRAVGTAVLPTEPSAAAVIGFLGGVFRRIGCWPQHLITDHGPQFTADTFRSWCRRRGIRQRLGAVGKYGSLAVVERFIRTMKNECTRRLFIVPHRTAALQHELSCFVDWFNAHRPHSWLAGRTPDEVYYGRFPACRRPRLEPRTCWRRRSPCARPHALVRGRPGALVKVDVAHHAGRRHLPIISLKRVA